MIELLLALLMSFIAQASTVDTAPAPIVSPTPVVASVAPVSPQVASKTVIAPSVHQKQKTAPTPVALPPSLYPGQFGNDTYPDFVYAKSSGTAKVDTFGVLCPAMTASLACDPYSYTFYAAGSRVQILGYVIRNGIRWLYVDSGINQFGGHDFGWVDGRTVS